MANKHNGEVRLTVDGLAYKLKLTHNKAAEAEPYMGKTIFDIDNGGIAEVRALLFVMAQGQHEVNSIDDAGGLLDEDPVACTRAVNEALSAFILKYVESQEAAAAGA
jgi:hypothetical protein